MACFPGCPRALAVISTSMLLIAACRTPSKQKQPRTHERMCPQPPVSVLRGFGSPPPFRFRSLSLSLSYSDVGSILRLLHASCGAFFVRFGASFFCVVKLCCVFRCSRRSSETAAASRGADQGHASAGGVGGGGAAAAAGAMAPKTTVGLTESKVRRCRRVGVTPASARCGGRSFAALCVYVRVDACQ